MTEPKWIPLSERKPEDKQDCWIFDGENVLKGWFRKNCPEFYKPIKYQNGFFLEDENGYPCDNASHWMPYSIPEPPKEEKPVDPDWEKVEEMMRLWRKAKCDNDDAIAAIYRFLKAKYGG